MEKTYITKNHTPLDKKWYLIDATNLTLGRLASQVGQMLMGKDKSSYSPHQDLGDYVIVINAEKINVTGKKERQKIYRSHSGMFAHLFANHSQLIVAIPSLER